MSRTPETLEELYESINDTSSINTLVGSISSKVAKLVENATRIHEKILGIVRQGPGKLDKALIKQIFDRVSAFKQAVVARLEEATDTDAQALMVAMQQIDEALNLLIRTIGPNAPGGAANAPGGGAPNAPGGGAPGPNGGAPNAPNAPPANGIPRENILPYPANAGNLFSSGKNAPAPGSYEIARGTSGTARENILPYPANAGNLFSSGKNAPAPGSYEIARGTTARNRPNGPVFGPARPQASAPQTRLPLGGRLGPAGLPLPQAVNSQALALLAQPDQLAITLTVGLPPRVTSVVSPVLGQLYRLSRSNPLGVGRLIELAQLIQTRQVRGDMLSRLLVRLPAIYAMRLQNLPTANESSLAAFERVAARNTAQELAIGDISSQDLEAMRDLIAREYGIDREELRRLAASMLMALFILLRLYTLIQQNPQLGGPGYEELGNGGLALGSQTNQLALGRQANQLALGRQANQLALGSQASQLALGNQANQLALGSQASQLALGNQASQASQLALGNQASQASQLALGNASRPLAILNGPAPNREITTGDLERISGLIESTSKLSAPKPGAVVALLKKMEVADKPSKKNVEVAKSQVMALLVNMVRQGKKVSVEELLTNPDKNTRTYLGLIDYVDGLSAEEPKATIAKLLYILRDIQGPLGSANATNEYLANSNMASAKKNLSNKVKKYTLNSPYNAKGGRRTRCGCAFGGRRGKKTRKSRR